MPSKLKVSKRKKPTLSRAQFEEIRFRKIHEETIRRQEGEKPNPFFDRKKKTGKKKKIRKKK